MKIDELRRLTEGMGQVAAPEKHLKARALFRQAGMDPENFYQDMEMSSRFVQTHRDLTYPDAQVNLHSHIFFEVLFCRSTHGVEYLVGSNRYRLQPGDIVVVPPEVSHRPIFGPEMTAPYRRDVIWVSGELMNGIFREFADGMDFTAGQSYLLRTAGTKWEFLGDMFRFGIQEAEQGEQGWEAAVLGNTMSLLVQLGRAMADCSAETLPAEKPELLDRVMAYIEANIAGKITLGETAKHFFVSESTISHSFKEKMGVSFYRYVTQRRLIAAKTLILAGHPLESVGHQVGFADYSSFYRAFRQEYGVPPRQYRKLQDPGGSVE